MQFCFAQIGKELCFCYNAEILTNILYFMHYCLYLHAIECKKYSISTLIESIDQILQFNAFSYDFLYVKAYYTIGANPTTC